MNNNIEAINSTQEAWRRRAFAQGILCLICCEPPRFEQRDEFYDTGVCEYCNGKRVAKQPLEAF